LAKTRKKRGKTIVDGKRLETLSYPQAAGKPTIVVLHEGLGSVSMWRDFPAQIADATGCGVLVYSRYGHGKSERLQEKRGPQFMYHEATVVLPSLLAQLGIERPILLGHSDGGSIALLYAATFPTNLRALILLAPHVFVEDLTVQSIAAIGTDYQTTDLPTKLARHHDHAGEMFWGWSDIWLDPVFRGWNIEDCLNRIRCPVLTIQGEQDEYGTLAQVEAIERRLAGAQKLILADCGHSPQRDQPAKTLEAISIFLRNIS
jgi:pimeloyl-ACP methyl ester carboxylesterase